MLKNKRIVIAVLFIIIIVLISWGIWILSTRAQNTDTSMLMTDQPGVLELGRGKLSSIPGFDKYKITPLQVDLRGYDLTSTDLSGKIDDLLHADFDTGTKWPYRLPDGFDPKKVMKYGISPGLNIDQLHKEGITGKGVGIAVIGGPIPVNHDEYRAELKSYIGAKSPGGSISIKGTAAVSIAAGKSSGVAPEADIYYISAVFKDLQQQDSAKTEANPIDGKYEGNVNTRILSSSINSVLDINKTLPDNNKIRVVCIADEWTRSKEEIGELSEMVKRAEEEGVFVIDPNIFYMREEELDFNGLGREPGSDPDKLFSYRPGLTWSNDFYSFGRYYKAPEGLLVPMDGRTVASPTGKKDYVYYSAGDKNMAAAYIAGLYALCCQVDHSINPGTFWDQALRTGDTLSFSRNNINYSLNKIVNPPRLIGALRNK